MTKTRKNKVEENCRKQGRKNNDTWSVITHFKMEKNAEDGYLILSIESRFISFGVASELIMMHLYDVKKQLVF
jgi:predicted HTH domain antitoxin